MPDVVDLAMDTTSYYTLPEPEPVTDTPKLTASGKIDGRSRAARAARGANGPAKKSAPNKTAARGRKDYATGLNDLGQLVAGGLFFVAPADAAAIGLHMPGIAKALDDLAQQDPRMAAVLDRMMQVGPYAGIVTAVAPLIIQILVNHQKMPAGIMGSGTAEQIVDFYVVQMTQQATS